MDVHVPAQGTPEGEVVSATATLDQFADREAPRDATPRGAPAPDFHVVYYPWAARVRATDNLVTRTVIGREGQLAEESYALLDLVLWTEPTPRRRRT